MSVVLFAGGFVTSVLLHGNDKVHEDQKFSLLAKRIQIDNPNDININFVQLRSQLESYTSSLGSDADEVSVYFEYLPTGVSIDINEQNESIAASLMKVPVVMSLYKLADSGKIDLDKKVALKQEWLNDEYGTLYKQGIGYELTIRDAAKLALTDSDNTAILLIFDQLEGKLDESQGSINYLDLEIKINSDERVSMGAQSYSSILKCLYFACYNNMQDSQEILEYLTKSSFTDRLTRDIPKEILVAHKIGTLFKEYQSDCGVFYVPNRNYSLCVMIKGDDPDASREIANISRKVYDFISVQASNTD